MLKAVRDMIRRMGFVGGVLLTLVFAAPAFESHACADEAGPATLQVVSQATAGDDAPCADCGPACANGCCHAPHSAIQPDALIPRGLPVFSAPLSWADARGGPLGQPDGPDRPPRS